MYVSYEVLLPSSFISSIDRIGSKQEAQQSATWVAIDKTYDYGGMKPFAKYDYSAQWFYAYIDLFT